MLLLCLKPKKMTFYCENCVSVDLYINHRSFIHSSFISHYSRYNFI